MRPHQMYSGAKYDFLWVIHTMITCSVIKQKGAQVLELKDKDLGSDLATYMYNFGQITKFLWAMCYNLISLWDYSGMQAALFIKKKKL